MNALDRTVEDFAAEIGPSDPVCVVGAGSRGGGPRAGERVVRSPAGIVRVDAAEMVVECGAATPVAELRAALAEVGQTIAVPDGGTIGGALAVGHSDVTRLAHGPLRDVLLQTHFVGAHGRVVKAGGATVKNVSGFDVCRLLVGSHGRLGFFADVLLRTRPLPASTTWCSRPGDPFGLLAELYRPTAILWDGATTWVRLDGEPGDVEATVARHGLAVVAGPPELPGPHRWSVAPRRLGEVLAGHEPGSFVAEIGVGVVHHRAPSPARPPDPVTEELHRRLLAEFDPTGRLNPGVDPFER